MGGLEGRLGGAAIVARLQESYGSVASPEIDAADVEDDARGQTP